MPSFKICACCGNQFLDNTMSVYKLQIHGKLKRFCSYGCYRRIQVLKENKKNEEIDQILQAAGLKAERELECDS